MKHVLLTTACLFMGACASDNTNIESYAGRAPNADIRTFFNGEVKVWGVFVDRSGDVDPRMSATLVGKWNGNQGTLDERFVYNNGDRQTRSWAITMVDDHHFTATAGDVIGTAYGTQYGNAINMKYTLFVLKQGGEKHRLESDDWIYLVDEKHAINRNALTKFGITAGDLLLSFEKK